jgi:hypothetical protein
MENQHQTSNLEPQTRTSNIAKVIDALAFIIVIFPSGIVVFADQI